MCSIYKCPSLYTVALSINLLLVCHVQRINSLTAEQERTEDMLKSFTYNHMDGFVSSSYCSNKARSYFSGARVRLSSYLNQTHPTVNAIDFVCSDAIQQKSSADAVLIIQRNVGNWTELKECPNGGFITGITLYMQTVSNTNMIAEEDVKKFAANTAEEATMGRLFDVFELGRTRYISGVSLNCSNRDFENDLDGLFDDGNLTSPLIPAWRNTVTLGRPSGMGLRLYCAEDRVMSGVSVEQEALLTYEEGERWIPLDITTRCSLLTNPVTHCFPELDWERIDNNMTCTNAETGNNTVNSTSQTGPVNVTCHVPHFVGLSPNKDIENLDKILLVYQPLNLEGKDTRISLIAKLRSYKFMQEWHRKYKLSMDEYRTAVQGKPNNAYLNITKATQLVNFTNVNYEEPEYSKLIRNVTKEALKHEFNVKQLVGYCSIYKIYFPLFRSQFQTYFGRKISGIDTKIIFPMIDENTLLTDFIEAKFGVKI